MTDTLSYLYANPGTSVAVDTETDGLNVHDGRSKCIGVSIAFRGAGGEMVSAYYGVAHGVGENISPEVFAQLEWVLTQEGRTLVFANRTFDVLSLETIGINTDAQNFYDVFVMSRLIDPSSHDKEVTLNDLSKMWLKREGKIVDWPYVELNDKGRPIKETTLDWQKKNGWPTTTPEMIDEYARVDAEITLEVAEAILQNKWWKMNPPSVWARKQTTMRTTAEERRRGVLMNMPHVEKELATGEAKKAELREKMGFNPKSHKDNMRIFIEELGLPVVKTSPKTGLPSFDRTVMEEYDLIMERMDSPLVKQVREYRGWDTAVGLLLRPYTVFTSPDGRLRTEYTSHVTATGRVSSRKPNLQQISKEAEGKPWKTGIKPCFIAKPGFVLLSADYSQLELRLATAYAEEKALQKVFEEGRDIFTEMSQDLGMSRQDTKTLTYSIQYGAGVPRIMNAFGVDEKRATALRRRFYSTYRGFRALDSVMREKAANDLAIKLWSGRIRRFKYPGENYKAMNALIQGGAADIVEDVWNWIMANLDNEDCRCLLQVHDALVFEVREDLADDYRVWIRECMEDVQSITGVEFPVRFAVEVSDWATA